MKRLIIFIGIQISVSFLQRAVAQQTVSNDAISALSGQIEEVQAKIKQFAKTDDHQLLIDAAKMAGNLFPSKWPKEMTDEAEQMLRTRLEVIHAVGSAVDKDFDPRAPENMAFMNVMPPVFPTNPPGTVVSGMAPAGIKDPVARKAYEDAIEKNRKRLAKIYREHRLKLELGSCVNSTWIFLLNLCNDSPAYNRGIEIIEETVKDTNVVRKLKRKGIGSPD